MNRRIDPWLIAIVASLLVLGLVMVYSASALVASEWSGDEATYFKRQAIGVLLGLAVCGATAITPTRSLRRYRVLFYSASIVGLAMCFVPGLGHEVNGATRWLGFGSVNVQPSAFAKLAVLLMLADYLHRWRSRIQEPRVVLRALLIPLPVMALILPEPDFGTTAIIGGLCGIMLFAAGMQARHLAVVGGLAATGAVAAVIQEPYRLQRVTSFLNPWNSADSDGYHTIQSWLAMHSGGLWGQGLGNSIAKLHFLPEPWTDYIAAVIAEELGFARLVLVITLYGLLVWRGVYIARKARDAFSMYLATAITAMLGFESFFNLGVVMGMLPPKGLVLPFVSYGASSIIFHLWAVGILLGIAAETDETPIPTGWTRAARPAGARLSDALALEPAVSLEKVGASETAAHQGG